MTPEEEVLGQVVELLDRTGIPFMVTGAVAASYHGHPRSTHDADVVIDPTAPQLEQLLTDLEAAAFYVNPAGARDALRRRTQFNVIHTRQAAKVDLIVRRDRPFSVQEFQRRRPVDFAFRRQVPTVTAEDAVLSKLEWARQGGDSERQTRDAAGIVELNPTLDRAYIEQWAEALGVSDLWRKIQVQ